MAQFGRKSEGFVASRAIKITGTETVEHYTVYVIEITLGRHRWLIRHRYSEFHDLHEKLVSHYKIDKGLLPPKKLFGNQSESFIKKRQGELETYLQTVLLHLTVLPTSLVTFLDFDRYEIHGLAQSLAEELYNKGDMILQAGEVFHITPLQLHAITARLKLAEPTCESGDTKKDLGHVLDFITRVTSIKIHGTSKSIGTSNINMNDLPFELTSFKALSCLEIHSCNPDHLTGVDHLKKMLKRLHIHNTLKSVKDILLVDVGFGQWTGLENESVLVPAWSALIFADMSNNYISAIDESVKLMPKVEYIDLSHNQLDDIRELQNLSSLTRIDISYNKITRLESLHTKLGNIKSINLSGNKLESLSAFSKLYSLETLDISQNEISQVLEIRHVSGLPCLERLTLTGNPVTIVLDYRTKILEQFGDRAREVHLDSLRATQKELDTVAILLAIQKSKETKDKQKKQSSKKPAKEAHIADAPNSPSTSRPAHTQGTLGSVPPPPSTSTSSTSALDTYTTALAAASDRHVPDNSCELAPSLYRVQIQRMRELGGAAWLTLLNEMHRKGGTTSLTSQQTSQASTEADDELSLEEEYLPPTTFKLGHQGNFSHITESDEERPIARFMLPETLPGRNDSSIITTLQSLLPDTHALTKQGRVGGGGGDDPHREERPVHLIWCTAVCYTAPHRQFPAGIFITTESVHVFEVTALRGDAGMPALTHAACVPLMNVQQIVLGYESQYIRIEEAFVGPQGTFTFLMSNAKKADLFLDSLKLAYRRAVPDLDQYEDPHIVVNHHTELSMKKAIGEMEGYREDPSSIQTMLYMLVHTVDYSFEEKAYTIHSLVITHKFLYLLREDYVLWPQPTFAIGPSTRSQFVISAAFPVMGRITGIQMYDSDTYSPDQDNSLSQNFSAINSSSMVVPNFIGYGVKLTFELGSEFGCQDLDIRVPTSGMRDKFLATLTQVRKEVSEKNPHPTKSKSRPRLRDGEGDRSRSRPKGHRQRSRQVNNNNSRSAMDRPQSDSSEEFVMASEEVTSPREIVEASATTRPDTLPNVSPIDPMCVLEEPPAAGDSTSSGTPDQRESPTGQSTSTQESVDVAAFSAHLELPTTAVSHTETPSRDRLGLPAPSCPQIRRTPPPSTLGVIYPSMELLGHLTLCNENMPLLPPLSTGMRNLACSTGEEIINFFHNNIAEISTENEELRHIMWSDVIPYVCASQRIPTCVLLSTRAIYFVSDQIPKAPRKLTAKISQPWKSHSRNKSDSYRMLSGVPPEPTDHHTSGILHGVGGGKTKGVVHAYTKLPLRELKIVHVGLFDQSVRLTGSTSEQVCTCVTRDSDITGAFVRHMMSSLAHVNPTPSPDLPFDTEQDFYRMFSKYNRAESGEYTHPSKVKFIYPSEDSLSDISYLLIESIQGQKPKRGGIHLLMSVLLFQAERIEDGGQADWSRARPRTLLLTEQHVALATEDHVSYPIPEFSVSLPDAPQLDIRSIISLALLKRIVVNDFTSHDVTLVFADEPEGIIVDTSVDHYSNEAGAVPGDAMDVPDVTWTMIIQNLKDKDKVIQTLRRQWAELHSDQELSVQVNS